MTNNKKNNKTQLNQIKSICITLLVAQTIQNSYLVWWGPLLPSWIYKTTIYTTYNLIFFYNVRTAPIIITIIIILHLYNHDDNDNCSKYCRNFTLLNSYSFIKVLLVVLRLILNRSYWTKNFTKPHPSKNQRIIAGLYPLYKPEAKIRLEKGYFIWAMSTLLTAKNIQIK